LPVILVGQVFPGINLPSIEYDHAAIAQHAAAALAAAGHERTAILLQHTGSAADASTCDAFAAARKPGTPAPLVLEHDGSLAQIESRLRRLARLEPRPTSLFVTKSLAAPAVLTILPRLGVEIPRNLSVICREDDPFLDSLACPRIAHGHTPAAGPPAPLSRGNLVFPTHQPLCFSPAVAGLQSYIIRIARTTARVTDLTAPSQRSSWRCLTVFIVLFVDLPCTLFVG
jgi:hypothetical protein